MKAKLFLAGFALAVAALPLFVACGGDTCDNANAMLASCATTIPTATSSASASSSGSIFDSACDGASACKAQCVVSFSCAQINGNDPAYTSCLVGCNGK